MKLMNLRRKRRYRCSPHITLHHDGRVTLAGIHYWDLRNLLTCALLRLHTERQRWPDEKRTFDEDEWKFEAIRQVLDEAIVATHPQPPALTLKERLAANQKERASIDAAIEAALAENRKENL